ncbi:MAG: hypothetical protein J5543_07340 [Bacteroidales bacterium]|nr:hypothetical protein [Bacteroidales bacterium]
MQRLLTIVMLFIAMLLGPLGAEETVEMQRLREARQQYSTDLPIHEEHDSNGQLTHAGVAIFNPTMQEVLNPFLWRGVERIVLRIALQGSEVQRSKWVKEHGIRLYLEACPYGSGTFKSFDMAYPILRNVSGVKVLEDYNRYRVLITGGKDSTTLRLSIPKERELIYGTDKKEEDERQSKRLQAFKGRVFANPLPAVNQLYATGDPTMWHTMGEVYYIDSLSTDGYYEITEPGDIVTPIWSPQHPKESVKNLLLGNVMPKGLTVEVMHRQYGGRYETWECNWETLLGGLKDEGVMEPFAAAQYMPEKGLLTGILVLRNTSFGFTHMLLLSIPLAQLGTENPARLTALLYTNTPQHNVYSLFEEYLPDRRTNNKPTNAIPFLKK